jgi:hypothetical protein
MGSEQHVPPSGQMPGKGAAQAVPGSTHVNPDSTHSGSEQHVFMQSQIPAPAAPHTEPANRQNDRAE